MCEVPLAGGYVSGAVRVGDTVRRAASPWSANVREVLDRFAAAGWSGAPRFLGYDDTGREIACHNDLSPKNTVYRRVGAHHEPVAFIDWDIAAPGRRIHDVAHMCWQYGGLGPDVADTAGAARRVQLMADAYGLADRSDLVDTIAWWQDRCWRGIEADARAGAPHALALQRAGAVREVRDAFDWVVANRSRLDSMLR